MRFIRKRERFVTPEEMNEILEEAEQYSNVIICEWERRKNCSLATHSFVVVNRVNFSITTRWAKDFKPTTYHCRLDGEVRMSMRGSVAYAVMQKYYKAAKVEDFPELEAVMPKTFKGSYAYSAGQLIDFNPKFNMKRMPMHIYDINSAYAAEMVDKIPDISTYRFYDIVGEGEVGFFLDDKLTMVPEGLQGDVVFKLIDSPYEEFARHYFELKKKGYKKAKEVLTYSVGYLQRINPFIRAYIVHRCANKIKSLLDENSAVWNTDAIYSTVPRPDLEIGTELGQWKYEYCDSFAIKGNNYQKGLEAPCYRGIPKKWLAGYDILTDDLLVNGNAFEYDEKSNRLIERELEYV